MLGAALGFSSCNDKLDIPQKASLTIHVAGGQRRPIKGY